LDHIVSIADEEATYAAASDRADDAAVVMYLLLAGEDAYRSLPAVLRAEEVV
jgi:hypothetical protein